MLHVLEGKDHTTVMMRSLVGGGVRAGSIDRQKLPHVTTPNARPFKVEMH